MNINLKSLKHRYVFRYGSARPWATVCNVRLSPLCGKVDALFIETISLIPLHCALRLRDIECIKKDGIYLKQDALCPDFTPESMAANAVVFGNKTPEKLRDLNFNTETGEITDIIVSKNKLTKKSKISVNNIYVKDNTIYIDKEGGR